MIANKFYTVQEAAAELDLTEARVRQLIASGQLDAEKAHERLWLIPHKALEKFKQVDRPNGVRIDRRKGA